MQRFTSTNFAVLIAAVGYGITFPLLSIRLEKIGVSGAMIGVHSAMPALGWIVGSALMPRLQARFGIKRVALGFLSTGIAALAATAVTSGHAQLIPLRFLFGGGIGMFYRSIEYWITAASSREVRGRNLGIYSAVFMLGIALGSLVQPTLGSDGALPFLVAACAFMAAGLIVLISPAPNMRNVALESGLSLGLVAAVPTAFAAFFAFGMWESIPAYLAPAYALRNGLSEDVAAGTLTAAATGSIVVPVLIGLASDRIGRSIPLFACALVAAATAAAIPFAVSDVPLFLGLMSLLAGCASSLYSLALAQIGDRYEDQALVVANAAAGMIYAVASLAGPILNGAALDTLNSHGLMASCCAIFLILAAAVLGLHGRWARRLA